MDEKLLAELVDRFLSWQLPESVCADPVVTWAGRPSGTPPRFGTSMLTAIEARQMIEHLLDGVSVSKK